MSNPGAADPLRELIDDVRGECLWFLRDDYYPTDTAGRRTVLGYIERYGDLVSFRRARALRLWHSPPSSDGSAG